MREKFPSLPIVILAIVVSCAVATAQERRVRPLLRSDHFGENQLSSVSPRPYGEKTYTTKNTADDVVYAFRVDPSADGEPPASGGVAFSLNVNQNRPEPIYMAAESRAENVSGTMDSGYAIYADIIYQDDSPEWGVNVPFAIGTHERQKVEKTFLPEKPVKTMTFYLLFRGHTGLVEFFRPEVRFVKTTTSGDGDRPDTGTDVRSANTLHYISFDGTPVLYRSDENSGNGVEIYVRDVAMDSDWIAATSPGESTRPENGKIVFPENMEGSAHGLTFRMTVESPPVTDPPPGIDGTSEKTTRSSIPVRLKVHDTRGQDRAVTVIVAIKNASRPERIWWLPSPDLVETVPSDQNGESQREYSLTTETMAGTGRLGRWPIAGVRYEPESDVHGSSRSETERPEPDCLENWILMDPERPAVSRCFYHPTTGELCAAFDLGFTHDCPDVDLGFSTIIAHDPDGTPVKWAFREQWEHSPFYTSVDERRIEDQGLWMPFAAISKVPQPEDFGFRFKEGTDEIDQDDARDVLTFWYTEPMTWWMSMDHVERPWTLEKAVAEAERLAESGDRNALAWRSSAMHDTLGRPVAIFLDTPWCKGAVWSMNSMPGIEGTVTDYTLKSGEKTINIRYAQTTPDTNVGLDGEYIDSSEGYVTRELDGRRDHFAAAKTPLTFERTTKNPAIFRGLVAYEYTKSLAEKVHRRGKFLMANATPDRLWWLAPELDVLGTETNWNWGEPVGNRGSWRPMATEEMVYRRALSGTKAYCFLQNTDFLKFTESMVDRYMSRSVAFGFFPGFFSADASTGHYFTRPELYERDRPRFRKYLPIAKELTRAGWRPVPYLCLVNEITPDPSSSPESSDPERKGESLVIERFGDPRDGTDVYYTIFNPTFRPIHGELRFSGGYVPQNMVILTGTESMIWTESEPEKLIVNLPAESLIVVKTVTTIVEN
ncbi:MAG: hypothetical protein Q4C47_00515 [Planctomycetia bacterium]|nr:hypothetical protein [Planctomycetia bacterium]